MKIYCGICGKPKPLKGYTPWSWECDAGYSFLSDELIKYPGRCDSKRLGLPWPPKIENTKGT